MIGVSFDQVSTISLASTSSTSRHPSIRAISYSPGVRTSTRVTVPSFKRAATSVVEISRSSFVSIGRSLREKHGSLFVQVSLPDGIRVRATGYAKEVFDFVLGQLHGELTDGIEQRVFCA